MGRITFGGVAEWVNDMQREGRSASRVRQAYHLLTGMLHAAVKDGRLPRNPAIGVDLPRLAPVRRRYLRHDQLHALADASGRYRVLVLTMGYCGLRWGEVSALRVHSIDLGRGRLNITDAVTEVNGELVFGTPKSHQSCWLPVPAFLLEELQSEIEGTGPDDLVFASPLGAVLRVANFRRGYFDRAAKQVGVPGLVPHEPRHTAALLAISAGASVKSVQRMLGHASPTLTLDRYGHLFPDELDHVRSGWTRQPARPVCTERVQKRIRRCSRPMVRWRKMQSDLRFCWVPPAGFEPATHGLGGTPGGSGAWGENPDSASDLRKRMATASDV